MHDRATPVSANGPGDVNLALPALDGETAQLRDGTRVCLRRNPPFDRARVLDFLGQLSRDSLELRFFCGVRLETVASDLLTPTERTDRRCLLLQVLDPDPGPVIARGEYVEVSERPSRAEVDLLVTDDRRGQGAATILLWGLAREARRSGIREFAASVLAENRPMLDVFLGAGFPCSLSWHAGEVAVVMDIRHEPATAIALRSSSGGGPIVPSPEWLRARFR